MASPYPAAITHVTAGTVGSFFVGQYYQMLQAQPGYVHRFYNHLSKMVRIDGPVVEAANSPLEIHSLIMSQSFMSIEIRSAHSIDSWSGGVLVMVSGSVQSKEYGGRRKFAQTFFLAPQEKGYFVLNDVLQYFDEEQIIEQPPTMLHHDNYAPQMAHSRVEPATEYVTEGIQGGDFISDVHPQESVSVDKYSIPDPQPSIPEVVDEMQFEDDIKREEPTASIPGIMVSSRDPPPVEDNLEEPIKHTYASILRSKGQQAPAPQPATLKSNPLTSEWDQTPEPPTPAETYPPKSSAPEREVTESADDVTGFDDEGEVTSVYVRNLSSSTTASEIEHEFKNFGRIKPGGVLIKSRKDADVYYAFVEFVDISGVINSVQASPILVNGRQLFVEERRPNSVAYRGRRGRGRGGYQQYENSRGRFNGCRSFGRGNGPDSRDFTNKPRGNGNGYYPRGGTRQDRGILGPQHSRNMQNHYEAAA